MSKSNKKHNETFEIISHLVVLKISVPLFFAFFLILKALQS